MATTTTKTNKLDELKKKFQVQLDDTRKKLDAMKDEIAKAREQNQAELGKKREEIHQRVEAQKQQVQELRDNLKEWQREKAAHTKEAVASWRQKFETDKLRRRAERAEDSAVDALVIAMLDADAAQEAVLDAIGARIDFETATPA